MNIIKEKLNELITASSMHEVMLDSVEKVQAAAGFLKLGKADVSEGFCSNPILVLTSSFNSWTVTQILLAYAFLP